MKIEPKKYFIAIILSATTANLGAFTNNSTKDNQDDATLRKISLSTVFQGLANTCSQVGKLAGAKTKKEKQAQACNLASTVLQFAATAAKEDEESKKAKQEKNQTNNDEYKEKEESDSQAAQDDAQEQQSQKTEDEKETKSICIGYLEQLEMMSENERIEYVDTILKNKTETETLLNEITTLLKSILIDELF